MNEKKAKDFKVNFSWEEFNEKEDIKETMDTLKTLSWWLFGYQQGSRMIDFSKDFEALRRAQVILNEVLKVKGKSDPVKP